LPLGRDLLWKVCYYNGMVDLSKRSYQEEIMDDLSDGSQSLYQALKELDFINKWLGGNIITEKAVKRLLLSKPDKHWHIADLGCGSGQMMIKLATIARKYKITAQFYGFDANPNVIAYARKHCNDYPEISFSTENIFDDSFKSKSFDVILTTLFLHHFDEPTLVKLFKSFGQQAKHIVVNDLHRHPLAYYSIKWLTALFSKSKMVKNDACLSVWRGFHKNELIKILERAHLSNYSLSWKWAFRWKLLVH